MGIDVIAKHEIVWHLLPEITHLDPGKIDSLLRDPSLPLYVLTNFTYALFNLGNIS